MRTIRRIAAVTATAAALALSTAAAAAGPEVVDPAGDARTPLGLNEPAVDLRSVDVAAGADALTVTFEVQNFPALQNRGYFYSARISVPGSPDLFASASNGSDPDPRLGFTTATLVNGSSAGIGEDNGEPSSIYFVAGSASVDPTTDRVTLSFPRAAVEAESARLGIPVFGAAATGVRADSISSTPFRIVATDAASGGPFVIGE